MKLDMWIMRGMWYAIVLTLGFLAAPHSYGWRDWQAWVIGIGAIVLTFLYGQACFSAGASAQRDFFLKAKRGFGDD